MKLYPGNNPVAKLIKRNLLNKAARRTAPFSLAFAAALALHTSVYAGLVTITENDGLPVYFGQNAAWLYNVKNTSDDDSIFEVRLYDLFSVQQPTFSLPGAWTGVALPGTGDNLWDIIVSASYPPFYIGPGASVLSSLSLYVSIYLSGRTLTEGNDVREICGSFG